MNDRMPWSRRRFLATSAAIAAAASLPGRLLRGQAAMYTRYNVASPEGKAMLVGYRTAIDALLKLPPSNPLNWYRNVLIHTLDCPHGNWWFLPWHRGYLGYFEQTIRQYSQMPNFAFPYWDWTANPEMPEDFFGAGNPLDPTSPLFIESYDIFRAQFEGPVNALYAGFSSAQQEQLAVRGLSTPDSLWAAINPANSGFFYPRSTARCLTAGNPSFAAPPPGCGGCATTPTAVSPETLTSALAPTDFITFGSGIVDEHSQSTLQGVLEGQPHNQVHNCIGGFMSDLMSPTDPIFMMHHSNIERLWLVWTDKQQRLGLPTLPTGDDLTKWQSQRFLFYVNSQGQSISTVAGDFATVGSFDYTYTPGSGSVMAKTAKKRPLRRDYAKMAAMPTALVQEAAATGDGPEVFAEVPIDPKGRQKGKSFHVLINPPAGLDPTDMSSPHHAATVAFFGGGHGHAHGPTTFVVQLSPALRKMKAAGLLKAKDAIHLFVAVQDNVEKGKVVAEPVEAKISVQ